MVDASPDPLVGQVVDGRYQVRARLARGGMATVYEALDLRLDRIVALKVMHRHLAEDPDFVGRFQREARAAARLTHPHVVGVYDQGTSDDLVYLAMEYVPSRTLRDVLRQFGPLTAEQALVLLEPVLDALSAAHAAGFVHRDIKPENVLIADDGRVKVADFGLARAVAATNSSTTQGMIIGTVAYLSPEQVERGEADGRSDVYAAGILLFEMVTGQVPHAGDSPLAVAYQHVNADVPPPSSIRPQLAPDVDALVVRSTRRDPQLRYQSAQDFLADVRRVRTVLPPPRPFAESRDTLIVDASTSARLAAGAARQSPPPPAPPLPPEPVPGGARRHRPRGVVIGVIAIVAAAMLAGLGGWYLSGPGRTLPTALEAQNLSSVDGDAVFSEDIAKGNVASTEPGPGEGVQVDGTVTLHVSKGPERYAVPDVRGQAPTAASAAITEASLTVGSTTEAYDDTVPAGQVAGTTPAIGDAVKKGTSVDVIVSKGPKPVDLPNVVGRKIAKATATLAALGVTVDAQEQYSEEAPKGEVLSMAPTAGTTVNSGTAVSLVVSKGPPPVTVPNLIDMPRTKAVAALRKLGLKARVVTGAATPLNRVYSQDPPAGTEIPKGSAVTIRII